MTQAPSLEGILITWGFSPVYPRSRISRRSRKPG